MHQEFRKRKRNREQIVASILRSAIHSTGKTRIMNDSCLSFNQLNKYLNYALESELLGRAYNGKYMTTTAGREFLEQFDEISRTEYHVSEKRRRLASMLDNTKVKSVGVRAC